MGLVKTRISGTHYFLILRPRFQTDHITKPTVTIIVTGKIEPILPSSRNHCNARAPQPNSNIARIQPHPLPSDSPSSGIWYLLCVGQANSLGAELSVLSPARAMQLIRLSYWCFAPQYHPLIPRGAEPFTTSTAGLWTVYLFLPTLGTEHWHLLHLSTVLAQ